MTDSPDQPGSESASLYRLIVLSDGVFGIAMTLLVVELTLPVIAPDAVASELPSRLWALVPNVTSFVISFLVVASYWTTHQRIFSYVVRVDGPLIVLNILFLMLIAFQPFPTSVLGAYGSQPVSMVFYASTLAATGLIVLVLWLYVTAGHRLVRPDLPAHVIRRQVLLAVVTPLVFLVSIVLGRFNPVAAEWSWASIAVILMALRWRVRGP